MPFSADEATATATTATAEVAAEEAELDAVVGSQQALLAGSSATASADGTSGKKRRANRDAPAPSKRTRSDRSDGVGDSDVSLMKVSELRAELGRLGLGTTGIKAVLVARLKAAIQTGAAASCSAQPEPPAAASAEGAGPSASTNPALLAAFDFELSQELKARLLGRRAKRLAFKRRYGSFDIIFGLFPAHSQLQTPPLLPVCQGAPYWPC